MRSIGDLQTTFFNPILGEEAKGFAELKNIEDATYIEGYVKKGMEYRPDLVADYYLGDSKKAWLITCFNRFTNGIRDYTLGRKIKIPILD